MDGRILVIEDDKDLAELIDVVLRLDGLTVHVATSGDEGLEQARHLHPDLVVLDIMLPGLDGWEVCRRLRQESDVRILILSARSSEVDLVRGLSLGADDYLCKPFGVIELSSSVRALLTARFERRQASRTA